MSVDPFPFLTASDQSEAITTCPICQEAFELKTQKGLKSPCASPVNMSSAYPALQAGCPSRTRAPCVELFLAAAAASPEPQRYRGPQESSGQCADRGFHDSRR